MNRDIIYIDVEDDITAIIGKIKASKEKIVALVPPKRASVLQSAVNLKLLNRTAHSAGKKLVIVSHSPALVALAGSAAIPVAKNLHSKPEVAEVKGADEETETVIDGSQLPVGEHAEADSEPIVKVHYGADTDAAVGDIEKFDELDDKAPVSKKSKKPQMKVPNFGSFRKKLFIGITGGVLLIIFLIWAIFFAPAATIIINASTSNEPISESITLNVNATTDANTNTVRAITKQLPVVDMQVSFTATGVKENKASGSVVFRNCQSSSAKSIPAGTVLTNSDGLTYATQAAVNVPGGIFDAGCTTPGVSAAVTIQATKGGTEYNTSSTGVNMSVAGFAATMVARTTTALSGGDSKTTTVVSADDIMKAKNQLAALPTDSYKDQLIKQFNSDQIAIPDSFQIQRADAVSSPAQGEAATTATLSSKTTFSMYGVNVSELNKYLDAKLAPIIAKKNNYKVYDNGAKTAKITNFYTSNNINSASLSAIAKIGPSISADYVKNMAKGKIYGDAQSALSAINGVNSVDIKFSYFWVTTVPSDENKIKVEFNLDNGK